MRILLLLVLLFGAGCATAPTASTTGTVLTPFPAHDFTLETLNGGNFSLSSMRERWVILNFWATWCAPCTDEMPALQTIASEKSGEVALFGINMNESAEDIRTYMQRYRLSFPILMNPDNNTFSNYQLDLGIPQTVIISPRGEIVWHQFGPIDLDNFRSVLEGFMGNEDFA